MDLIFMRPIIMAILMSSVLLCSGYYWDIKPLLTYVHAQEKTEKQLHDKYHKSQIVSFIKPASRHITRAEKNRFLMAIMKNTEQQGLQIQSAEVHSDARQHVLTIHMMVLGQLTPILSFFQSLNAFQFPVILNHFSLELVNHSDIQLNAHLDLYTIDKKKQIPLTLDSSKLNKIFTQFDSEQDFDITDVVKKSDSSLHSTPLRNLRFIGLIAHDSYVWSVLRLPNDEIIQVKIGENVGLEQAKVISMNENGIILDKNNQPYYIPLII